MKKTLTIKELKKYLESMSDEAEVLVRTRYGKTGIGLIEETSFRDRKYVLLNVVYDE